jgi:hypothetical protein
VSIEKEIGVDFSLGLGPDRPFLLRESDETLEGVSTVLPLFPRGSSGTRGISMCRSFPFLSFSADEEKIEGTDMDGMEGSVNEGNWKDEDDIEAALATDSSAADTVVSLGDDTCSPCRSWSAECGASLLAGALELSIAAKLTIGAEMTSITASVNDSCREKSAASTVAVVVSVATEGEGGTSIVTLLLTCRRDSLRRPGPDSNSGCSS